jgi:hypothetical protein
VLPGIPLSAGDTIAGPVGLFGTTVHELGHAMAAVVTGLDVEGMVVRSDGSGTTYVSGSFDGTTELVVSSAGYLVSLLWAAGFLLAGRWAQASRAAFVVSGALLVLCAFVWMDGVFAFGTAAVLGAGSILAGAVLKDRWVTLAATVLGGVLAFSGITDVAGIERGNVDAAHAVNASGLGLGGIRGVWLLVGIALVGGAIAARVILSRRQRPPTSLTPGDDVVS